MSIGTTLAQARESAGLSVDEVAHGDPDPPHPAPGHRERRLLGAAAATSTPAGTSAPSPSCSVSTRRRCCTSSTAARPPEPPRTTEVFEPETRRGPSAAGRTGARRWPPRWSLVVGFGVVQAFAGGGDGADDRAIWPAADARPRRLVSSAPPSSTPSATATGGSAVAQAPRGQGDGRRPGHRAQLGPGHDRDRAGALPGAAARRGRRRRSPTSASCGWSRQRRRHPAARSTAPTSAPPGGAARSPGCSSPRRTPTAPEPAPVPGSRRAGCR